jgi:hypothetical protein
MAVPDTKVFIAFDLTASGQNFFVLDDAVKGELDSSYILGGTLFEDVTSYVESVSISRGKSRQLERYSAGNLSVTLHNESRIFDPFNTASPYYGQIQPRKSIIVETNGVRIFSGIIDDWDLTYDISGKSYAIVSAVDGFLLLSAAALTTFNNVEELSSDRVIKILDRPEVAWPNANRLIDTGLTSLQADEVIQNQNALSYLQLIETTENGQLFMTKSGAIKFKNRTNNPAEKELAIFSDDGTLNAIPYTSIGIVYGSDNLYNRVTITRLNGIEQTVDSITSQQTFGVGEYSLDGLLLTSDENSLDLANYLLGLYSDPELRLDEIQVQLHNKTDLQLSVLTGLELGDLIQVKFTPTGQGIQIDQYASVIKIENSIGIATHEMTIGLASIDGLPFVLDDLIYGRLDSGYILSF